MKIEQYDGVRLKDGREGTVVEILGDQEQFFVDVGSSPEDWETVYVSLDEIADVTWRASENS